jgi:hypothetical protein
VGELALVSLQTLSTLEIDTENGLRVDTKRNLLLLNSRLEERSKLSLLSLLRRLPILLLLSLCFFSLS